MNSGFWPDPLKINPKTLYDSQRNVLVEQAGSIFGSKFKSVTDHDGSKMAEILKFKILGIFNNNMN